MLGFKVVISSFLLHTPPHTPKETFSLLIFLSERMESRIYCVPDANLHFCSEYFMLYVNVSFRFCLRAKGALQERKYPH